MLAAMKWTLVVAASAGLLAVAGCGSVGDREAAASGAAVRMLTAVDEQDGAQACAVLAPETVSELQESAGKPCAQAILEEDLPKPGAVAHTAVYGQWAQVRLSDDTVFLGVFGHGWRVVAAGCSSQGDRPYDCTLQGG
jgi:hypothetical protein